MILIRNLVARTIKYDDIDSLTVFPSWTKNRIETQTNQRGRWNERRTYSPPPSHPNPRHVVYFIALLALLHQFPSVYTSPAVVTALSLFPPSCPPREHHSTRIKYWLRFWFIVIAGGIARGSEEKPVRFERSKRDGRKRRRRRWRRRVDSAEGGWSPLLDGEGMTGMEGGKPFHRWQMHLPKRCGRFCLVLRRHAACRYYSAFLFFTHCYPSRPPKILMLFVRNNRGIYFRCGRFREMQRGKEKRKDFFFFFFLFFPRG